MTKMTLSAHSNKWGWDHCKRVEHDLGTQFRSVAQSCPTLCDPTDCNTPGFAFHYQHLELAQTHVHWSRWCYPTISFSVIPVSSWLQTFPALGSFPVSQFFTSGGLSIGVSASASVLPMNLQDWFLSLLFSMLSRLVIAFPSRNKHLLISWLQSPSVVILEPP